MVVFGEVWNLQGTKNAKIDNVKVARKENCKEITLQRIKFVSNGICKEWILQGNLLASESYIFHTVNVC